MISQEALKELTLRYHTSEYPNMAREYCQHLFLSELYKIEGSESLLFKGGTALRILYGSSRFSEDLDFSLIHIQGHRQKKFTEHLFTHTLAAIEHIGMKVALGSKPGPTSKGYYGQAVFYLYDYLPLTISMNISTRNGKKTRHEVDTVASDFIPPYMVFHLPQEVLIEEKVFGALLERKKARDFYDLYFMMRKGMFTMRQKRRLASLRDTILIHAEKIDFKAELSVFLPFDQQNIIKNFQKTLANELHRQLAG